MSDFTKPALNSTYTNFITELKARDNTISSLFSDYSYKQRWVYVPKGMSASFEKDKVLDFPTGSALIKTFYYPIDERDLSLGKKLMETRLLLKKDYGWEAVSYAWNEAQNEAFLKKAGKTIFTNGLIILARYAP